MDGKKRKVMFLIYSLCGGGAERVLVETVNRLPKDRYDVTLMTLFHDDTRAGMLSPEVHYRPALRVKNGRAQKILSGIMQYIIPSKWLYRWFFKSDADVEVAFMEAFPTKSSRTPPISTRKSTRGCISTCRRTPSRIACSAPCGIKRRAMSGLTASTVCRRTYRKRFPRNSA